MIQDSYWLYLNENKNNIFNKKKITGNLNDQDIVNIDFFSCL
jgi:hypothetical protein